MRLSLVVSLGLICGLLCQTNISHAQSCGNVPTQGCCLDDQTVQFCSAGSLRTKKCTKDSTGNPTTCGWSNGYRCTNNTSADPAGKFVRNCADLGASTGTNTGSSGNSGSGNGGSSAGNGGSSAGNGTGSGSTPSNCGNVTFTGCCVDDTHRQYCSSTKGLVSGACKDGQKCGWNLLPNQTDKYAYTCGESDGEDPTGANPKMCDGSTSNGGNNTGNSGSNGGNSGSTDGNNSGNNSLNLTCDQIPKGCCNDDGTVLFCSKGALINKPKTCANGQKCGWNSYNGKGNSYTCGESGEADPSGQYVMSCSQIANGATGGSTGGTTTDSDTATNQAAATAVPAKNSTDDEANGCSLIANSASNVGLFGGLALLAIALILRRGRL